MCQKKKKKTLQKTTKLFKLRTAVFYKRNLKHRLSCMLSLSSDMLLAFLNIRGKL